MSSVTLANVVKRYGKVEAVRGISMEIANGEFMAFLGPSGCGKSSTMRMIAGLEEITGGDILFDGSSVIDRRPSERNVAMAFETYALYPTLTVYENLAFPLRAARWSNFEVDKRVREVAEIVGVTELFERKPGRLSSGQSQMVGLARALIRKPNVFLLDEPISHMDTRQRFHMRAYIKRLHIDLGYTMIFVTHDQEDAMALADRVAVMGTGTLRQVGTPKEIYNQPADTFVASFIGSPPMNFLDCMLAHEDGRPVLKHKSVTIQMPAPLAALARQGQVPEQVTLGIRPYYITLGPEKHEEFTIPAEVFVVEPLGDMGIVMATLDATRIQVVVTPDYRAQPKQAIWLKLDPAHILLFDKQSGAAIVNPEARKVAVQYGALAN